MRIWRFGQDGTGHRERKTHIRFHPCMCSNMDFQMRLLEEALFAVRNVTLISLLWVLWNIVGWSKHLFRNLCNGMRLLDWRLASWR
jgi:hypothetical protein